MITHRIRIVSDSKFGIIRPSPWSHSVTAPSRVHHGRTLRTVISRAVTVSALTSAVVSLHHDDVRARLQQAAPLPGTALGPASYHQGPVAIPCRDLMEATLGHPPAGGCPVSTLGDRRRCGDFVPVESGGSWVVACQTRHRPRPRRVLRFSSTQRGRARRTRLGARISTAVSKAEG
jgi:hypothetical protein